MLKDLAIANGHTNIWQLHKATGINAVTIKRIWDKNRSASSKTIGTLAEFFGYSRIKFMKETGTYIADRSDYIARRLHETNFIYEDNTEDRAKRVNIVFRKLRLAHGWSLYQLAKTVGCHPLTLQLYEMGRQKISAKLLAKVMALLDMVETDFLVIMGNLKEEYSKLKSISQQQITSLWQRVQKVQSLLIITSCIIVFHVL